ncbi:hypothetical protein ARMSODRAFT_980638 [Armillaria solidipes]|uniref:Uncharacterized protein n=1 Tax=Armillaria solidipes TaxID=1076256 RepID=A0A2H3B110_9AGAR|nr:hypothetical protein ARMSODRAFT_980638 [Armillaria solidipes]
MSGKRDMGVNVPAYILRNPRGNKQRVTSKVSLTAKAISFLNFQWEVRQAILHSAKGLRSFGEPPLIPLRLRVILEKHPDAKKRMLFGNNETRREWNSTLVIAWISLGILLLMAGLVYKRHRCRKLTDIESKALHAAVILPVEDWENVERQTMIMVIEDNLPLA